MTMPFSWILYRLVSSVDQSFQPPPFQDPAILVFQQQQQQNQPIVQHRVNGQFNSSLIGNNTNSTPNSTTTTNNLNNHSMRETGVVEKLLHSYGFIQCCERDARLFFHFSEYTGSVDTMKPGDPVEFQMSYDRKTGKPIACAVVKLTNGTVSFETLSEERVTGTVVAEPKNINRRHTVVLTVSESVNGLQDSMGRVSYERSGECFFLPFSLEDIEDPNAKLKAGDNVTFLVATDKRNGNVRARKVKQLQPFKPTRFQGVVCSMKDSFGFIERSDVVKEIFFHYSEYKGNINELVLGDDVEFAVQARNNKEVATNITQLPPGTVIFEDIAVERVQGKIVKTLKGVHNRRQSEPLAGRIAYDCKNGMIEIPYGDKDQQGDYTLQPGDLVQFNIATDRRDKLQRATNIELSEDSFQFTGEKREKGIVATVKEGYGFIRCADREGRMFFHFSENVNLNRAIVVNDEVEFSVSQDPTNPSREIALRIRFLPKGSVVINKNNEKVQGVIDKEPQFNKSPTKGNGNKENPALGVIKYDNGETVQYSTKDIPDIRQIPKNGDKVEFTITENRAKNIRVLRRTSIIRQQGFIATIKDSFGFIENGDHEKEVFFHFSAFDGDPTELDLGDEVEYTLSRKSHKVCAESIRKLPKGTVSPEELLPGVIDGRVIRPMRIINPDQEEFCGLVQIGTEEDPSATTYPYGITSLADKREFLQKGDVVKFQLCLVKGTNKKRATNIIAMRKCTRATVDSIKGQFGFLNYEAEEGKKLFFHMTEIQDNSDITPGDELEFVVVQNQRSGKYSACSLRKISSGIERPRPERLVSRLKSLSMCEDGTPKLRVLRQPKGPDGTKGFKTERTLWRQS